MKTSEKGKKFLVEQEGLRLKVYLDTAGLPTIGVGHLIRPEDNLTLGDYITDKQAMEFLDKDLEEAEDAITNWVDVDLNQNQFDALVSFTFNLGVNAFKKSTLLKELNLEHYVMAASEFLKWNKVLNPKTGKKEISPAILSRRQREKALFETPIVA